MQEFVHSYLIDQARSVIITKQVRNKSITFNMNCPALCVLQMIDRICVKVQDHLNSLRNSETDIILEDVRAAENLIKDARNSKTVRGSVTLHAGPSAALKLKGFLSDLIRSLPHRPTHVCFSASAAAA